MFDPLDTGLVVTKETCDDEYMTTAEDAHKARSDKKGFLYRPKDNELLIDLDNDEQWETFSKRSAQLEDVVTFEAFASHTEGHRHVIVTMKLPLSNWQRLALQAILGDPVSGFLDIKFLQNTGKSDTCLFLVNERK